MALSPLLLLLAAPAHASGWERATATDGGSDAPDVIVPVVEDDTSPIINGGAATEEDYPATGGMIMDAYIDLGSYGAADVRIFVCSSTLIAPDVVLLASHCLDEDSFTYGIGTMDIAEIRWSRQADLTAFDGSSRRKADWPDDAVSADDWMENEDFSLRGMDVGIAENSDIALLFLDTPITDVPFVYVPTEEEGDQIEEGALVTVVGWGVQQQTAATEQPAEGTYAIKQMGESVIGEVGDYEFQVGPNETDVRKCHGDSGGPTFINIETESTDTLRIVGVTSHAYDTTDCKKKGGVDTRVFAYRDWIDGELRSRCEDGTRVWCDEPGLPTPPLPVVEDLDDTGSPLDGDDGGEKGRTCGCSSGGDGQGGGSGSGSGLALVGALAGLLLVKRRR